MVLDYTVATKTLMVGAYGPSPIADRGAVMARIGAMCAADVWVHEPVDRMQKPNLMALGMVLGAACSLRDSQGLLAPKVVELQRPWPPGARANALDMAAAADWRRPWGKKEGPALALYLAAHYYWAGR